jgi:hypothetical protein
MRDTLGKKLHSVLLEMMNQEMDEMAKHANPISRPIKNDNGELIGHDMRVNPNDESSSRVNVIFTCDIQEFINSHPDLIKKLKEQYGNIKFTTDTCPKYNPHRNTERQYHNLPGEENDMDITKRPYEASGEKYDVQEISKRIFNPILESQFGENSPEGKEFAEVLNKRSIPGLILKDPKYIDRHVEKWNNDHIEFRTHNFNRYLSNEDFLKSVMARIRGRETPMMNTTHQSRIFNKIYRRYELERKNEATYKGKTEIYKLDRQAYEQLDLNISLFMLFEVKGDRVGDSFIWNIRMTNKFGSKLPTEYKIRNGLQTINFKDDSYLDNVVLQVSKTAHLEPEFMDENKSVMESNEVQLALREACHDFKEMIESIPPQSALEIANVTEPGLNNLRESKVNKIFNKIIKNIK